MNKTKNIYIPPEELSKFWDTTAIFIDEKEK